MTNKHALILNQRPLAALQVKKKMLYRTSCKIIGNYGENTAFAMPNEVMERQIQRPEADSPNSGQAPPSAPSVPSSSIPRRPVAAGIDVNDHDMAAPRPASPNGATSRTGREGSGPRPAGQEDTGWSTCLGRPWR